MITNQRKKARLPEKIPKKPFPIGKLVYYVTLVIFAGSMIYVIFFSSFLDVSDIEIIGNEKLSKSSLISAVNDSLRNKYLGVVNGNNILLIRSGRTEKLLTDEFGRLRDVRIIKKFPSTLQVEIFERQLMFFVCDTAKCFLVDREGNFKSEDDFRQDRLGRDELILLNDLSNNAINPEEDSMEQDYIDYVAGLKDRLKLYSDIDLENKYETPSRVSSDLRVMTKEGWKIFFNKEIEMEKSLSVLNLFLQNKLEKDKRKDLEYVDLRADNKIYYKFKAGTQVQMEEEKTVELKESEKISDSKKKKK